MEACKDILELLSARMDGELSREESRRLDEHLASCEACRRELSAMERVWTSLGALKDIPVPAGLEQRVYKRVMRRRGFHIPMWAYGAAAAAAVLIAAAIGYNLLTPKPLDTETKQIVKNMDVLQDLDMLQNLDVLEEMGDGVLLLSEEPQADKSGTGSS